MVFHPGDLKHPLVKHAAAGQFGLPCGTRCSKVAHMLLHLPNPFDSGLHDAEKCGRFSDDIMLQLFNLEQDSDFRPTGPKIILF